MKAKLFICFLIFTCLLSSCNSNMEHDAEKVETLVNMNEFTEKVLQNKILIDEFYIEMQDNPKTRCIDLPAYENLKKELLPTAQKFIMDIEISNSDIYEMLGDSVDLAKEKEDILVGILMYACVLDFGNSMSITRGGTILECLQEATGIADAAFLIGTLSAGTMSKAQIKAAIKLAAKAGGKLALRSAAGVGLVLLAAEVAYCMS